MIDKTPFPFDADKAADALKEMMGAARLPMVDAETLIAAHRKNLDAMLKAGDVLATGYTDLCKRQAALVEAAFAEASEAVAQVRPGPLDADQAAGSVNAGRAAFEKATADAGELFEMAQKIAFDAFAVMRERAEEAMAEAKAEAAKLAA